MVTWRTKEGQRIPIPQLSDPHLAAIVNDMLWRMRHKARPPCRNDMEVLDRCAQHPLWEALVTEIFVRRIEWRTTLPVHYELIVNRNCNQSVPLAKGERS